MLLSLKTYTKEFILNDMKARMSKIASLLDDSDFEDQYEMSLSWLDQSIYAPRMLLIKPEDFVDYNGGCFVNVTGLCMDVINHVYYENRDSETFNTILPEVGLLPLLTNGRGLTTLSDVTKYLQLKTNLNLMNRQLDFDGDYELWSPDEDGNQMLQLKYTGLTKVEFLPSLSCEYDELKLYEFEYSYLKDMFYARCNLLNAEQQMSAQALGVGKEASNLASYWEKKIENVKKEFLEHVTISYMA